MSRFIVFLWFEVNQLCTIIYQIILLKIKLHQGVIRWCTDSASIMTMIDERYYYTPIRFSNGVGEDKVVNEAGTNEGSCRIFDFARLNELSEEETLACSGSYYREDVLADPDGNNHGNICTFMIHGWSGISFGGEPLKTKR